LTTVALIASRAERRDLAVVGPASQHDQWGGNTKNDRRA
jgi:hypothetical protein